MRNQVSQSSGNTFIWEHVCREGSVRKTKNKSKCCILQRYQPNHPNYLLAYVLRGVWPRLLLSCVEVWQQIKWKTLLDNCYRTCRRFGGENQNWRCAGGSKWWYLKCQPPVSPSASYCLFSHSRLLLWTAAAIYCQLCCQDLITPPGSWQWDWASEDVSGREIFLDSKGKTVSKERKRWDKASQARLKTQVQLCPLKIQRKKCPGSEEGGLKLFKREGTHVWIHLAVMQWAKPIPKALNVIRVTDMADSLCSASIRWWHDRHTSKAKEGQKV